MTNRIDLLDTAITRRGRFSHQIEIGMPSQAEVHSLLEHLLAARPHDPSLDIDLLAEHLAGRPVSDTVFAVHEAARMTAKSGRASIGMSDLRICVEMLGTVGGPQKQITSTTVLTNYSIFRPQHGHRSRRASSAAASSSRSVVMESGTCRCLRRGAPGPEAFG